MHARFKLVTGSPRRDEQDPVEIFAIVGLSGAYQARNASQMLCIRVVFGSAERTAPFADRRSVSRTGFGPRTAPP